MDDVPDDNQVCEICGQPAVHRFEGGWYCAGCWDESEENEALWAEYFEDPDYSCAYCHDLGGDIQNDGATPCPVCGRL